MDRLDEIRSYSYEEMRDFIIKLSHRWDICDYCPESFKEYDELNLCSMNNCCHKTDDEIVMAWLHEKV